MHKKRRLLLLAFAILVATVASVMPVSANHPCPMTFAEKAACVNDCKLVCNYERACTGFCMDEHCLC